MLTRDPVADRIGAVVVCALTRTRRGLVSEPELTASEDGFPSDCAKLPELAGGSVVVVVDTGARPSLISR